MIVFRFILFTSCACLILANPAALAQKKKPQKRDGTLIGSGPAVLIEPRDEHKAEVWQRATFDDGRLSILLPGQPLPYVDPEEKIIFTARYSVTGQNASFKVSYIQYPTSLETPEGIRAELSRQRNNLLAGQKITNMDEHDILVQGRVGKSMSWRESYFDRFSTQRINMFVDHDRLYILQVLGAPVDDSAKGKKDEAFQADISRKFFTSVALSAKQN